MIDEALIRRLQQAKRWVFFTGAGMSAESGVPTFRDAQSGLWAHFKPEELATPQAFKRNPKMVWEWYAMRRQMIAAAQPNAGHYVISELEKHFEVTTITQNIDNLHTVAGSTRVLELHGNIFRTKCFTDDKIVEHPLDTDDIPPLCPRCRGYVRPDVVWFGELLPEKIFEQSMHAASKADVFLCIGTSGVVYPAAGLPIHARQSGALLIDINPETTPISEQAAYHIQGTSGPILTQLFEKVTGHFMESRT